MATDNPLNELAARVAAMARIDAAQVRSSLLGEPEGFGPVARQTALAAGAPEGGRLVLLIDQFERIFGPHCESSERQAFITALHAAASPPSGPAALVVLSVRGDFLVRCTDYVELRPTVGDAAFLVTPMTEPELRRVITEPASVAGATVRPDLLEMLLREVKTSASVMGGLQAGAGVLPLLSHVLAETWNNREAGELTVDAYRRTGGIDQAVAVSAQDVFDSLNAIQQQTARYVFLSLVAVDGGSEVSAPVSRAKLARGQPPDSAESLDVIVERFAERRLLVLDGDQVHLAHEAMMYTWPRLREWLDESRASRAARAGVRVAAEEWNDHAQDSSFLYTGAKLELALQVFEDPPGETGVLDDVAGDPERAFVASSLRASRRQKRRNRLGRVGAAVLVVAALSAAVFAMTQSGAAVHQRDIAQSGELAAESSGLIDASPGMAKLIAFAAWDIAHIPAARFAMLNTAAQPGVAEFSANGQSINSVAFSPQGRLLASGSNDGTIRLWSVATGRQIMAPLGGYGSSIDSIAFSPNGRLIAAGSETGTVRLWNVATGDPVGPPLNQPCCQVFSVAFSPNGRLLATASINDTVRLWDVAHGRQISPVIKPGGHWVQSVAFSPNGKLLATGTQAGTAQLWKVTTGQSVGPPMKVQAGEVSSVAFSPDGRVLATANGQPPILWSVATGRQLASQFLSPLETIPDDADSLAFSRTGLLVTGSYGGVVRLWDPVTGAQIGGPFKDGDGYAVSSVAFSPDGELVAGGGKDGVIRLWNAASPGHTLSHLGGGHTSEGFSGTGSTLATGTTTGDVQLWNTATARKITEPLKPSGKSSDSSTFGENGHLFARAGTGYVRIWSVVTGRQVQDLKSGNGAQFDYLAFSPDGRVIAAANDSGKVWLWKVASGRLIGPPMYAGPHYVSTITFSPDGKLLATGDYIGDARVWDLASRRQVSPTIRTGTEAAPPMAFSPGGTVLATADAYGTIRLWNILTGHEISSPLNVNGGAVSTLRFSRDGTVLASGSASATTVKLWDFSTGGQIGPTLTVANPSGNIDSYIDALAFSPQGNYLAATSDESTGQVWNVNYLADPEKDICAVGNQVLTRTIWNAEAPTIPFTATCSRIEAQRPLQSLVPLPRKTRL